MVDATEYSSASPATKWSRSTAAQVVRQKHDHADPTPPSYRRLLTHEGHVRQQLIVDHVSQVVDESTIWDVAAHQVDAKSASVVDKTSTHKTNIKQQQQRQQNNTWTPQDAAKTKDTRLTPFNEFRVQNRKIHKT